MHHARREHCSRLLLHLRRCCLEIPIQDAASRRQRWQLGVFGALGVFSYMGYLGFSGCLRGYCFFFHKQHASANANRVCFLPSRLAHAHPSVVLRFNLPSGISLPIQGRFTRTPSQAGALDPSDLPLCWKVKRVGFGFEASIVVQAAQLRSFKGPNSRVRGIPEP